MKPHVQVGNERGVALVMALLVLLVMSLLSAALMMSLNTETQIAGHSQREAAALNTAEAGLAEAAARIRVGDIPDNGNANMTAKIFNALPGSVPVLPAPQIALATAQPAGKWLKYSTASDGADVLTVQYRTDGAGNVLKYDPSKNPAIQTATGSSIWVITSTGYAGSDVRKIQEEVVQKPFNINVKGAMAAAVPIKFSGDAWMCGYDHLASTPAGTDDKSSPDCSTFEDPSLTALTGGWSTGTIDINGSADTDGQPTGIAPGQVGFYSGPWDALSMTQAEFFQWIGPRTAVAPNPPRGVYYLDNNSVQGDASGSYSFSGGDGEGLLYVDGDLSLNGNFNFRGMIYVEGDLDINGKTWILGSLIAKGTVAIKLANGACTVLYSSTAIQQALQKYGGNMVAISWKEL